MSPGYMYPGRATCIRMSTDTCCSIGIHVDCIWRRNYYSFMSRSTCIPLYPATDGRQTGDSFVADTRNMLTATSGYNLYPATCVLSRCKRSIRWLIEVADCCRCSHLTTVWLLSQCTAVLSTALLHAAVYIAYRILSSIQYIHSTPMLYIQCRFMLRPTSSFRSTI